MGFSEMVFIFFFALIVFGPKRLPEIGRQIGKLMAEFKRHSNEFKSQLENEIRQMELQEAVKKMDAEMPKILPPQNSVPSAANYLKTASSIDLEAKPAIPPGDAQNHALGGASESPVPENKAELTTENHGGAPTSTPASATKGPDA
jgi:Tat protein translocase TatB subunit